MKYYRATQTITGEYADDHTTYRVEKGEVHPEGHRAVQHDLKNGKLNFSLLEDEESSSPKPRRAATRSK